MDKDKRRGFEPQKFATFMFYGAAAFGLAWLTATPVAFGQEGKDSTQRSGAALGIDDPKDVKKKAGKSGEYKDMEKKPAASDPPSPAHDRVLKSTISPGTCPENPCTTPTTGW